jgi:hypothetical protein
MSVPEYVFLHRIQEFYDQLRAGRNLWKIDETLGFIDERGRQMIKKWIQDERFAWTFGRGYALLMQPAPVISLVVDSDSDRPNGNMIGNYARDGIEFDAIGNANYYWEQNAKLKMGSFLFVFTAPNSDMLTAMYCLTERALYEGETPPAGEEDIITFSDYGIHELSYRGSDVRPDQNYVPTATWARTLNVSCSYMQTWTGKIWGKSGFALSIDIGDVYSPADNDFIQKNPEYVNGIPVLPVNAPGSNPAFVPAPGISLSSISNSTTPVYLTTTGENPSIDNLLRVAENTALSFDAIIGANIAGQASALWKFSGIIRRAIEASSTTVVGLTAPTIIADPIFETTYIDVYADTSLGALMISVTGIANTAVYWSASIVVKELI